MSNRAVAIIAGATLLVGVLIGRASARDSGSSDGSKESRAMTLGLDPKSYPRTEKGAATAAQAYSAALLRSGITSAEDRSAIVNAISSNAMRDQIAKEAAEAARVATKLFDLPTDQGQVVQRSAPLGYRVVSFTNDSAKVEIWSVTVFGEPGVGHGIVPQFNTNTVELAWERDAWRLAGTGEIKDGPTPIADDQQASRELLDAVKDLQEFTHEAG